MARYKGKDGAIRSGTTEIGEVESYDIETTVNELDANVMGSDWTGVCDGQLSASGSIAVLRDPADPGQILLRVGSIVDLNLFPEGNTTGLTEISGQFLITNRGLSVSVGDLVKTSYSFRNEGEVTEESIT